MHSAFANPVIPMRRFQAIAEAVRPNCGLPEHNLQLIALACVSIPESPGHIAIKLVGRLHHLSRDIGPIISDASLAHVVAALLYADRDVESFHLLRQRAHHSFLNHGLEAEPAAEALAVASMMIHAQAEDIGERTISRLVALHNLMRKRHWWKSVAADLPTAALLASHSENPRDLEKRLEYLYLQLIDTHFAGGTALHIAAAILLHAPIGTERACQRLLGIAQAFGQPTRQLDPPSLAILSLLPHSPQHIVEQYTAIHAHIAALSPDEVVPTIGFISAGLTFLDLVHHDAVGGPLTAERDLEQARLIAVMQGAICSLAIMDRP